jgi:hypothetical protein
MKVKVEQAETAMDFIAIHSELKDLWVKIRLENEGIDTASLKAEAEKFDSIVADAKQNQQKTDDLFEVNADAFIHLFFLYFSKIHKIKI